MIKKENTKGREKIEEIKRKKYKEKKTKDDMQIKEKPN